MPLTLKLGRFHWSASWTMTLLTALAAVLFVDLGRWQWHRAQQKQALLADFQAGAAALSAFDPTHADQLPRYTTVRVSGQFDAQHQFLLENMSYQGQPGYQVLTPMLLADGHAILVNRGWLPITASRAQLPNVALETPQASTVTGKLDNLPVAGIALGHAAPSADAHWPKLTSFPTMPDLSSVLGRPLEARQLLLNAAEPQGYVRDWHPGGIGPERHLSYAIQWWGFAALALVLYGYLNWRKSRR